MPSAHRRVGLVVDDDVANALETLRSSRTLDVTADARLVRIAVLDGAVLRALITAAVDADAVALTALDAVQSALVNLPELPDAVRTHALREIEAARSAGDRATRRERQRAMLAAGASDGSVTLELKERLEAYDPLLGT